MNESASVITADYLVSRLRNSLAAQPPEDAELSQRTDEILNRLHLIREIHQAVQRAEYEFRGKAHEQSISENLIQLVINYPISDQNIFQEILNNWPEYVTKEYSDQDLQKYIPDDWKGEITPSELRHGLALYLNCCVREFLKIPKFQEIYSSFATLRIAQNVENIADKLDELLKQINQMPGDPTTDAPPPDVGKKKKGKGK